MEKIAAELNMAEKKQGGLSKACESLHAGASSLLRFSLEWKDLEDHLDSAREELRSRLRELESREQKIGDREKELEVLGMRFQAEMASKSEELGGVERAVDSGKNHLHSLKLLIEEVDEELGVKERQFSEVERRVLEVERLVMEKERKCDLIDRRINERTKKLNWVVRNVEERSKEVELKGKEVEVVREELRKYREDMVLKERELSGMMGLIEERKRVYELREEEIEDAGRLVKECDNEVKLKKDQLSLIQKLIEECDEKAEVKKEKLSLIERSLVKCSNTLESRENMIREMELKVRDFYLLKKSMEEWFDKLECKERELEGWFEKLELKEKQFEPKLEELCLMDKRVNECLDEVQLKEMHFDSLQKSIHEREKHLDSLAHGLQVKENQLEQQAKELELKQKEIDSIRKSSGKRTIIRRVKKKTNILDSQLKIEQLENTPANNANVPLSKSIQSGINMNSRDLQLFLNEHLKRHDLLGTEISETLQASSDPAKLVLDAIQGFYPSNSVVENRECDFDSSVIRRSCILLLEELKGLSPQINPQVREEAKKLAVDWKDKIRDENWFEVYGLFLLLTTYDLTSTYEKNKLENLLVVVPQRAQATEIIQALGISDKPHESSLISSPVKIGEPESSLANNGATFSSANLQPSATADATNLQGFLNEHLNGNHSIQKEMLAALQMSSDPAKLVLDEIQTSFAQYWRKGDVGFGNAFMSRNIALLEELIGVSPHVGPHLKGDAIKLAGQWKAKMRADTENSLESLGFLQFVATYGLLSSLKGDEINRLLGMIYQHKQALELCSTLGFAEKIPGFIQNLIKRKRLFEAVGFICTFKVNDKFPPVPLLKEYVEGARKSYRTTWKKKISVDEKDEVVNKHIGDLRAVIQCIKDYNLESDYPSKDIEIQIVQLKKIKENWRKYATSLASKAEQEEKSLSSKDEEEEKSLVSKVEQENKKEKKRSPSTSTSKAEDLNEKNKKRSTSTSASCKIEQEETRKEKKPSTSTSASSKFKQRQQFRNKRHWTSHSAVTPYAYPTFTPPPAYLQPSYGRQWHGHHGGSFGVHATQPMPNAGMHRSHLFLPYPHIYEQYGYY